MCWPLGECKATKHDQEVGVKRRLLLTVRKTLEVKQCVPPNQGKGLLLGKLEHIPLGDVAHVEVGTLLGMPSLRSQHILKMWEGAAGDASRQRIKCYDEQSSVQVT